MSDKPESGQEQTEVESVPAPKSSEASGDSSISSGGIDEEAILKRLEPRIEQEVERRVQSVKDKRIGKLEQQVEGYGDLLGQLKGVLPDEVLNEHADRIQQAEDRKILRQLWEAQQTSGDGSVGKRDWKRTQQALQDVFELAGLHDGEGSFENSSAYIDFYKLNKAEWDNLDATDFVSRARQFAEARKGKAKNVSEAAISQSPGGGASEPDAEHDLQNYIKEMKASFGKGKEVGNAIQRKYREKGVDVDNVPASEWAS